MQQIPSQFVTKMIAIIFEHIVLATGVLLGQYINEIFRLVLAVVRVAEVQLTIEAVLCGLWLDGDDSGHARVAVYHAEAVLHAAGLVRAYLS